MPPNSTDSDTAKTTRKWFVGPAQINYFKFVFAGIVFWLVRTSPLAPYIIKLPGTTTAGKWAFKIRVLSRDFDEIEINGLPDKYKTNTETTEET